MEVKDISVERMHEILRHSVDEKYKNLYITEYTYPRSAANNSYGTLRIDAIVIDITHQLIKGYELKRTRRDFKNDKKWTKYSMFCSSLCIVCPENLIMPDEIESPFGLIWVKDGEFPGYYYKKNPKNFQANNSLAWVYRYLSVIENELPRLQWELRRQNELNIKLGTDLGQSRLECGVEVIK